MAHVIFYMYQPSGTFAGMCACDCMHQIDKTAKSKIDDDEIMISIYFSVLV